MTLIPFLVMAKMHNNTSVRIKRIKFEIPFTHVFELIFIFSIFYFFYLLTNRNIEFNSINLVGFFGVLLYLGSHALRAVRLWLLFGERNFKFTDVLQLQLVSSFLGNVWSSFIGDLFKILLFGQSWKNDTYRMPLALIFLRSFDLFIIGICLIYFNDRGIYTHHLYLIFFIIFLCMNIFALLPKMCRAASSYLIRNSHSNMSTQLVKMLNDIGHSYQKMKFNKLEISFLVFLLSISIWIIELFSLRLFLDNIIRQNTLNIINLVLKNVISHSFIWEMKKYLDVYNYWMFDISLMIAALLLFICRKKLL